MEPLRRAGPGRGGGGPAPLSAADGPTDPGPSLTSRVAKAGAWAFAFRIGARSVDLLRTVILAHLLAPSDFGVFGITLLALGAIEVLSHSGFNEALIQTRDAPEPYLDTAFTVQLARGALVALVIIVSAPWVAGFFGEPHAVAIFRLVGLSSLVSGLANPATILFRRDLDFGREVGLQAGETLTELVVAVGVALVAPTAWALALGMFARAAARALISYRIHPFRPHLRFDPARFRELFRFGRVVLLQGVVLFLLTQGDDVFVGKALGAAPLAFYRMAYRFSNLSTTEIGVVVFSVAFPALSSLQHDRARLGRAMLRTLQLTSLASLPLAAGIFVLAPEFTMAVFGQKWMPMVAPMQVLALYGALHSLEAAMGPAYLATARLRSYLSVSLIQLLVMAATMYPLSMRWGIQGTAVSTTLAIALSLVLNVWTVRRAAGVSLGQVLRALRVGVLVSGGFILAVIGVRALLGPLSAWASLCVLGGSGLVAGAAVAFAAHRLWGDLPTELAGLLRR